MMGLRGGESSWVPVTWISHFSSLHFTPLQALFRPTFLLPLSLSPLQALFRPMSMMIPDYALVAEVMLFRCGGDSVAGAKGIGVKGGRAETGAI